MPMYDYYCPHTGKFVEAVQTYEDRDKYEECGQPCNRVWLNSPGVSIPIHHQAAPNATQMEVHKSMLASSKHSSIRNLEPGMDKDAKRAKAENQEKRLRWVDSAVEKTVADIVL